MQIAPVAEQSVVVSTVSPTASIPSGSTLLSQRQRVPDSSRLARITSRYVTAMMRASASLKTHSPVNAAVSGAPSGCALTVNDGRLVCSIRLCHGLPCPVGSAASNAASERNAAQPVSRPLGRRRLARTRCVSHPGTCETQSRYCSRWSVDFQMVVVLVLDAIAFGVWRDRFPARLIPASHRRSRPQRPIKSAFRRAADLQGVNGIRYGCARSTRRGRQRRRRGDGHAMRAGRPGALRTDAERRDAQPPAAPRRGGYLSVSEAVRCSRVTAAEAPRCIDGDDLDHLRVRTDPGGLGVEHEDVVTVKKARVRPLDRRKAGLHTGTSVTDKVRGRGRARWRG